ncbi:hypothetical protein F3Y22_tig00110458pilonHSYRG00379 [Hibiscus syriacus]|uniref:Uncharacterized protein n=1 Tax=Hibiscus syriacus TaxID=106335 RepID=A0A6A3AJM1_HIBSY|nr:hypothetical protein F3Y22_tig00110458pilonHSYRG00379 [Hibiscus syriacus]
MPSNAGIVVGTFAGILGLIIIAAIALRLKNSQREADSGENETYDENKETDKEKELAKMLRELGAYYQKQSAPPLKTAVDVEAVPEKQTIERLIKLVLDEKPARGHFPDGRPLAVKLLHNDGLDKRIQEQFMAEHKYDHVESRRDSGICSPGDLNAISSESQEWFPKQVWEKFDKGELEEIWDNIEIEEKGGAEAATPPIPFQHLISSANVHSITGSRTNSTADYD